MNRRFAVVVGFIIASPALAQQPAKPLDADTTQITPTFPRWVRSADGVNDCLIDVSGRTMICTLVGVAHPIILPPPKIEEFQE